MTRTAIATQGLSKHFGDLVAVDDMTLDVGAGGVVGFVGPNGSGKSTFIRTILGLLQPTAGTGTVLGEPIEEPARFADQVGALIENPAFVGSISARDNLRSLAALRRLPDSRVDDVLEVVGLSGRDRDQAATYSLGMKQRLGIAAALLADPELLVLDEPTNGLDPAGIVEIRRLLRRLADEGRTVLVSSHLLSEIQAACDELVVIRFGRLLYSGRLETLMDEAAEHVLVAPDRLDDLGTLADLYRGRGWSVDPSGSTLRVAMPSAATATANELAARSGITLRVLTPVQESLEEVFLRITGSTDGELAVARGAQHQPDVDPSTHELLQEVA